MEMAQILTEDQLDHISSTAILYTAILAFVKDEDIATHVPATAVLGKIGQRFFFLTAGHVAKLYKEFGDPFMSIDKRLHHFRPKVVRVEYIYDEHKKGDGIDIGYMEIAASDAHVIEDKSKVFASLKRMRFVDPIIMRKQNCVFFLQGFPKDLADKNINYFLGSGLLGENRPNGILSCDDLHYIDLALNRDLMVKFDKVDLTRCPQGNLGGASGSGIWIVDSFDQLKPQINLVGIATYHTQEDWKQGEPTVGAVRGVQLKYILRKIYQDYDDLREDIASTFPDVQAK